MAEQKVVAYMEKINKAQRNAEQWEHEHKKVQMRHNLVESERVRQIGISDKLEKVLNNDIQLNKNKLAAGEEGLIVRE